MESLFGHVATGGHPSASSVDLPADDSRKQQQNNRVFELEREYIEQLKHLEGVVWKAYSVSVTAK